MTKVELQLVQTLGTSGARAIAAFEIQGRHYLAIPQLAEDIPNGVVGMNLGNSDTTLLLYRLHEGSGEYQVFQTLPVPGGEDAEFFTIDGRSFLATASLRSGQGPYNMDVESIIFEWNGTSFVEFQRIATFAAKQWRYFSIKGRHFLGLAQGVQLPNLIPKIPADSVIYEWDGNKFQTFQKIPSKWGYNYLHFAIGEEDYLAYADHVEPSIILRWDGNSFVHFQTLDGAHGRAFAFFQDKNESYLAFALLTEDSVLYRWNGTAFDIHQKLTTGPGGRELAVVQQHGQIYLVLVNFITGTRENPVTDLQSAVFVLENGQLKEVARFPTLGGTDATPVVRDNQIYLIIAESLAKDQRFRTASRVYKFTSAQEAQGEAPKGLAFQVPEFLELFTAYTSSKTGIGATLTESETETTNSLPLLVATSFDMILFPGKGIDPSYINFRLGSRGFKELAAVSHLGPALASLIQIRDNGAPDAVWQEQAQNLLEKTRASKNVNSTALWKDFIQVEAFQGREAAIASMVDYACTLTIRFLETVLADSSKLNAEFYRENYIEATGDVLGATVPYNAVMIATFFLVGLDLSYRSRKWLRSNNFDWKKAMVIITGQQGRETSGVTISTSSVAQILLESSDLDLPLERLYIAPHGAVPKIQAPVTPDSLRIHEHGFRSLWNAMTGMTHLGETMFAQYPAYALENNMRPEIDASTLTVSELPKILSPDDWFAMNTRMRVVVEDARQLLSGCVTDYAAKQLRIAQDDLTKIVVPGLDGVDFSSKKRLPGYGEKQDIIKLSTYPKPIKINLPAPIHTINANGGVLAFRQAGPTNAEPIVWIHGLPLDSRSWSAQYEAFADKYHNIFVDLRGYGASSKLPADVKDVTQLYCDDILAVMDHLKIPKASFVGFASAGHVALRFSAQQADRVNKLVTLNASPKFKRNDTDYPYGFTEEQLNNHFVAASDRGIEEVTNAILDPAVVFQDLTAEDASKVISWFRTMSYNAGTDTLNGFFKIMAHDDDRQYVPRVKAPTLLISSSLGKEVPAATALYLRQNLQQAKLVEVPDADHFLHVTRAAIINELISGFLSS